MAKKGKENPNQSCCCKQKSVDSSVRRANRKPQYCVKKLFLAASLIAYSGHDSASLFLKGCSCRSLLGQDRATEDF